MSYEWTYSWTDEQIIPWAKWVSEAKAEPTKAKGIHFKQIQEFIDEWRNTHKMTPVDWTNFEIKSLTKDTEFPEETLITLSQLNFLQKSLEEMMLFLGWWFNDIWGHYAFTDFIGASKSSLPGDNLWNGDFFPDNDWESKHIWYPEDNNITRIKRLNILEMRAILELLNEDVLYTQVKTAHTSWAGGSVPPYINTYVHYPQAISWTGNFLKSKRYKISSITVGVTPTAKVSSFNWSQESFSLTITPNDGIPADSNWFGSPILKIFMIDGKEYYATAFYFGYFQKYQGYDNHYWNSWNYCCDWWGTPPCHLCAYQCISWYNWYAPPGEIEAGDVISVSGYPWGHTVLGNTELHQGYVDASKFVYYEEGWAVPFVNYVGWGCDAEDNPMWVGCHWNKMLSPLSTAVQLSISYSEYEKNKALKSGVSLNDYVYNLD